MVRRVLLGCELLQGARAELGWGLSSTKGFLWSLLGMALSNHVYILLRRWSKRSQILSW